MNAPRDWRALMTAAVQIRKTLHTLTGYDAIDHSKDK